MAERTDSWKPKQYDRFLAERRLPFDELVGMCAPTEDGVVYDLGCGTGNRTVNLADALQARLVVGIDTSSTMLEAARAHTSDRVRFAHGDLASFNESGFNDTAFSTEERPDIIVSNAALHWVTDHEAVLRSWRSCLTDGGQLAVQVPANFDHPTQQIALSVAERHGDWFENGAPHPSSARIPSPRSGMRKFSTPSVPKSRR